MSDTTDDRPFAKRAGQYLTNLALMSVIRLSGLLPYRARVRTIGWVTSRIIAPLAGFRRRIRDNLAHTMPGLDRAEVERLVRAVPDNMGRALIETYSGPPFVEIAQQAEVTGPGLEVLAKARDEGKPVIIVTAHFGNYDAARASLIHHGFEVGGFYRPLDNPYVNKPYTRAITAIGEPLFTQSRKGMANMVRHLKAGGVLAIVADRHAVGGEVMPFFGKPAATSLVTAELALRFDAPLLPVYGLRKPDGIHFEIVTQEPIPHTDPETMTREITERLESFVREHMDQWFWIHRRWKV
ncbi:lysophospholipid acyltransferase family protein [Marinibacterium profundimaris]|uniref:Lauroyl acyltransferase n=1 Tax=Marinibacterium profundimaris TaxID=1679460 RepID=A0A225NUS0_9RHOB|nr:lysophospholipid acyltransferase family protein [Marinibacterium profundimaris]OWU77257.1 lauroyl acyltransferase [Marinibacterium profundimaris]